MRAAATTSSDDDNDNARQKRPALFVKVATKNRMQTLDEAVKHAKEAERLYEGTSARIEYCKSKGVDYENVIAYADVLEKLASAVDSKKHLLVRCDDSGKVQIIIGNTSLTSTSGLGCPLCLDRKHRLALCPNLPDELRPFVS
jgi:hypothetical protein